MVIALNLKEQFSSFFSQDIFQQSESRYFMPMGDVGGKVAVAFGVLFVLLVVGVALKEVMD